MKEKNALNRFFAGALIGAANAVPGVSGGTMAVVTGVYDRLLASIGNFFSSFKEARRSLSYLAPILFGALAGLILCLKGLSFALENHPRAALFFFIGLIMGSLPFLFGTARRDRPSAPRVLSFLLAFGGMIILGLSREPLETEAMTVFTPQLGLLLFGAGAVAAATMIIPGISGSFVLLYLGLYATFSYAVTEPNLPLFFSIAAGGVCGLICFSKLISWLFRRFRGAAFYGVTGLVSGSIAGLWPRTGEVQWALEIALFGAGGILAFLIGLRNKE